MKNAMIKFRQLQDKLIVSLSLSVAVALWSFCWFFRKSLGTDWWALPVGVGILMGGISFLGVVLYRQDRVAERRIASLEKLEREIRRHTQKEILFHCVCDSLREIFELEHVTLYLKKEADQNYHLVYSSKANQREKAPQKELPQCWEPETILTQKLRELIPTPTGLYLIEQKSHPETKVEITLKEEIEELGAYIVVGMVMEERLRGFLCLGWTKGYCVLTEEELSELDIFSRWLCLKLLALDRMKELEPLQPWLRFVQVLKFREKSQWS